MYFVKDRAQNATTHKTGTFSNAEGAALGEFTARLHLDFEANAKYVSFFIPEMPAVECPEAFVLNDVLENFEMARDGKSEFGLASALKGRTHESSCSPAKYIFTRSAQCQKRSRPN